MVADTKERVELETKEQADQYYTMRVREMNDNHIRQNEIAEQRVLQVETLANQRVQRVEQ